MRKESIKKFFRKKLVIAIMSVFCVVFFCGIAFLAFYLHNSTGAASGEVWASTMPFTLNDSVVIHKKTGKDFTILNFADIQIDNPLDLCKNRVTYKTMRTCVNEVHPDLITLSGDNCWGRFTTLCAKRLITVMESFATPWAPVFGNHDCEGKADLNWLGDQYEHAGHCLFRKGASDIGGVGNYVITILEGDKIVHTLIMMDSHTSRDFSSLTADELTYDTVHGEKIRVGKGYDYISASQIEWYKWVINGITALNGGKPVESTVIFHIPLVEYYYAYKQYEKSGFNSATGSGTNHEDVGCSEINSGLFDVMKKFGSTKNVLVGHDHINDSSILYQGIRLSYALKTGNECYWVEDGSMNGGSVLTLNAEGHMSFSQHFVSVKRPTK